MVLGFYVKAVGEAGVLSSGAPPTKGTKRRTDNGKVGIEVGQLGITRILSEAITDRVVPLK